MKNSKKNYSRFSIFLVIFAMLFQVISVSISNIAYAEDLDNKQEEIKAPNIKKELVLEDREEEEPDEDEEPEEAPDEDEKDPNEDEDEKDQDGDADPDPDEDEEVNGEDSEEPPGDEEPPEDDYEDRSYVKRNSQPRVIDNKVDQKSSKKGEVKNEEYKNGKEYKYRLTSKLENIDGYEKLVITDKLDSRFKYLKADVFVESKGVNWNSPNINYNGLTNTVSLELNEKEIKELSGKTIHLDIVVRVESMDFNTIDNTAYICANDKLTVESETITVKGNGKPQGPTYPVEEESNVVILPNIPLDIVKENIEDEEIKEEIDKKDEPIEEVEIIEETKSVDLDKESEFENDENSQSIDGSKTGREDKDLEILNNDNLEDRNLKDKNKLPKTGSSTSILYSFLGMMFISVGLYIRKKYNN